MELLDATRGTFGRFFFKLKLVYLHVYTKLWTRSDNHVVLINATKIL